MDFHRLGVKFFVNDASAVRLQDYIPIFHGWIQNQSLPDHLLIDIHDYSHIHQGPGILLVAHEGNVSIDMGDGRPGLFYYRKAPTALPDVEHVSSVCKSALHARRLFEKDAGIAFSDDEFLIVANDRLAAPNDEPAFQALRPVLASAIERVFEKSPVRLTRLHADPRERLAVRVEL